ncbi:hypothetical protein M9458_055761, partial [Cirrhinus mrigala]
MPQPSGGEGDPLSEHSHGLLHSNLDCGAMEAPDFTEGNNWEKRTDPQGMVQQADTELSSRQLPDTGRHSSAQEESYTVMGVARPAAPKCLLEKRCAPRPGGVPFIERSRLQGGTAHLSTRKL